MASGDGFKIWCLKVQIPWKCGFRVKNVAPGSGLNHMRSEVKKRRLCQNNIRHGSACFHSMVSGLGFRV